MTRLWTYHILDHHGTELDPIVCNQRLRIIRHLISFLLLGVSVLCGYLYFVQYYKWRDCFDEIGRCFDSQHGVVYLEQSGIACGVAWRAPIVWSSLIVSASSASGPSERCFLARVGDSLMRCGA